jgi:hypothetical protein
MNVVIADSGPRDLAMEGTQRRDTAPPPPDVVTPDLPPGVDLTTGLAYRWKFDEGFGNLTSDSSGKGNTGTLSGNGLPMWTAGAPAIAGNTFALSFDGVDDYVAVTTNLAPVLGGTASLSCWIKTTQKGNDNSPDAPGVTGVEQNGGSNDIFWGYLDSDGRIGLRPGAGNSVKSTMPVSDDMWHHVVMTRDKGTGRLQIFVDGKLAQAADGGQNGDKSTAITSFGRIAHTDGSAKYFRGVLDDVRVWDRVLGQAEVSALFAGN